MTARKSSAGETGRQRGPAVQVRSEGRSGARRMARARPRPQSGSAWTSSSKQARSCHLACLITVSLKVSFFLCKITVKACEGLPDHKPAGGLSCQLPVCSRQCRCSLRRPPRRCGAGQGQGRGARRDAAAPGQRGRALGGRGRHGEPVAGAAAALVPARPRTLRAPRARARPRCFLSTLGTPAVSCRLRRLQEVGKSCTACPPADAHALARMCLLACGWCYGVRERHQQHVIPFCLSSSP